LSSELVAEVTWLILVYQAAQMDVSYTSSTYIYGTLFDQLLNV